MYTSSSVGSIAALIQLISRSLRCCSATDDKAPSSCSFCGGSNCCRAQRPHISHTRTHEQAHMLTCVYANHLPSTSFLWVTAPSHCAGLSRYWSSVALRCMSGPAHTHTYHWWVSVCIWGILSNKTHTLTMLFLELAYTVSMALELALTACANSCSILGWDWAISLMLTHTHLTYEPHWTQMWLRYKFFSM